MQPGNPQPSPDAAHPTYLVDISVEEAFAGEVDADDLVVAAKATLASAGLSQAEMTIVVGDDAQVQALNRDYRGVDAATDVLSFAAQEGDDLMADLPPELRAELDSYLGDLIIAFPYTKAQAADYAHGLAAELRLLVVHGTLHLLGYDHQEPEQAQAMWQAQRTILDSLGDQATSWLNPVEEAVEEAAAEDQP
jgi:probable rRNA maturation factor